MKRFVHLIHHPEWTESRLADVLRSRGHVVDLVCHAVGEPLPPLDDIDGLVIAGGPVSVWQADEHPFMQREIDYTGAAVEAGVPFFGACLGAHILAAAHGATTVAREDGRAEFGFYPLEATAAGTALFDGLDVAYQVHYEHVDVLPAEATHLARTDWFENQAFSIGDRAIGVQFHPDARGDVIEGWWHDNAHLHDRPGIQPLAEQLVAAAEHEAARAAWTTRVLVELFDPEGNDS